MREIMTTSIMKSIKRENGFTLIEVLAACVILVILLTAFLGYFIRGSNVITRVGKQGENLYKAQLNLEQKTAGTDLWSYTYPGSLGITLTGKVATEIIQGNDKLKVILSQ
ncbi:type IV pilus modification PilV family protein [Paenibacillus albus]|uniref:Type II secretion system protein n=1 Tax=Paenibacillus albus TaxID=2495582 RepID=A0A3S9ACF6_9BACL|nr:type II secretion system protein [Paenibacillus albus]AZN43346.1 type II secretion system protein [Paenibacillus albus]